MNKITRHKLPNGITCLFLPTQDPVLNVSVYLPGGRLFESEKNSGLTYLLLNMMLKGALENPENAVFNGRVNVENHADFCGFSVNGGSEEFPAIARFLAQLMTKPVLHPEYLQDEKENSYIEIQKVKIDPLRRPVELFYQSLFSGHPYAHSRYGSNATLESMSLEQLVDWHQEILQVGKLLITIAGDIESKMASEELFEIFGMIPVKTHSSRASVLPLVHFKKFTPSIEESSQHRTSIVLGHKGVDAKDPRYHDLEIMRNWLAGARGQLHMSLREKLSIAQTVNAYNVSLLRGGAFFLHAITKPENETVLTDYMATLFSSLSKLVISKEAFELAKKQAKDLFTHGLRRNDALSYHMASQHMTNRNVETIEEYHHYINNVSLAKLTSTISEVFFENSFAMGVVRGSHG